MSWLDTLAEIRKTDWNSVPEAEREAASREVVQIASYAAAAAAVVPIPLVDTALLLPIHTTLVMTIGHIHGRNLSDAEAKRVALEIGAVAGVTMAGRAALSALKKILLPGIGGVLAAPAAFAVTWALGFVSNAYFKDPSLSREDLKKMFSQAFREGKASYSDDKRADMEAEGEVGVDVEVEEVEPSAPAEPVDAEVVDVDSSEPNQPSGTEATGEREGPTVRPKKRSL